MKKYISFIYKFKKTLMAIFILINLTAIFGITQIKIATTFDIFKTENSQYIKNQKLLEENFPSSDQMIVITEYSKNKEDIIIDFEEKVSELVGVKFVKGLKDSETALPFDINELSPIKEVDGQSYAVLTIFPNDQFSFSQLKILEEHLDSTGLEHYIGGDKYMQNKIFDYLLFILLGILPFAIFILFNIFRIQMRSVKATMLSILPAVTAALWTLGFAGLIGNEISILTVLAPIFTIIIGSADGLHFISHVQEFLGEKHSMRDSLTKSLSMVGVPMIITTVTSVAGFIALLFMNTKAIFDLAIFASIGITLAGIITWVVLPTINSLEKIDVKKKSSSNGITIPFNKLFGSPSIIIVAVLLIVSIFGIPKVNTEFNQLMMYKNSTEVNKSFEKIMSINGGTVPFFALIENSGNPLGQDVSDKANDFSNDLLNSNHVSKVMSIYSVSEIIKDNLPEGMPPSLLNISDMDIYDEMVNDKYSKIVIFPSDLNNETIENIVAIANDYDNILLTGTQLTMHELNKQMIAGQKTSLLIAFIIVFIALLISLRKIILSLVSMLPILATTICLFAFLGFSGVSLNLFTTTLFSITIGVGIDYAIHFTSIYNQYKSTGLSSESAVAQAYAFSSRPIIANALGFSLGLTALMFSPLRVHLYISLLMWVSMVLSSTLSLSFLPTILKKMK